MKRRVLALVHDHLVPPRQTKGIDVREAEWKMEFDVIETLREMGHQVRVRGVHDDLSGIRPTVASFSPHIVFNLLEAFAGVRHLRSERGQLPGAAAPALHRLQSARADPGARQGAVEAAARPSPRAGARLHGGAARAASPCFRAASGIR